jgi:hypothetical protein
MCVSLLGRDKIQEDLLSSEPPLVCHFAPLQVVFHSSDVMRVFNFPSNTIQCLLHVERIYISHVLFSVLQSASYEA